MAVVVSLTERHKERLAGQRIDRHMHVDVKYRFDQLRRAGVALMQYALHFSLA